MESELLELLAQRVTIETRTGVDGFNRPTYGTGRSHRARILRETKLVRGPDGQEKVSSTAVWLEPSASTLATHDRITLPDGTQPPILQVRAAPDETGDVHHVKVRCE